MNCELAEECGLFAQSRCVGSGVAAACPLIPQRTLKCQLQLPLLFCELNHDMKPSRVSQGGLAPAAAASSSKYAEWMGSGVMWCIA